MGGEHTRLAHTNLHASWLQLARTIVTVGQDHCYSWSGPLLQLVKTIVTVGQDHCYSWSGPLLQLVRTIVTVGQDHCQDHGQDHCYSWSGPLLQLVRTIVTVGQDHCYSWPGPCVPGVITYCTFLGQRNPQTYDHIRCTYTRC